MSLCRAGGGIAVLCDRTSGGRDCSWHADFDARMEVHDLMADAYEAVVPVHPGLHRRRGPRGVLEAAVMSATATVNSGCMLWLCRCCARHGDARLLYGMPVRCVSCGDRCSCEGCHAEQEEDR